MPEVEIVFYKDDRGNVPIDEWLHMAPRKARAKCLVAMKRLKTLGHELRRPEADYIGDGLYELRTAYLGVSYRIL